MPGLVGGRPGRKELLDAEDVGLWCSWGRQSSVVRLDGGKWGRLGRRGWDRWLSACWVMTFLQSGDGGVQ